MESCPAMSGPVRSRRDRIGWRLDPVVSRLSAWSDEDPVAMRKLLTDPVLQRQVLEAIDDVVGPADQEEHGGRVAQ